jgi:hypothetical protein
VPRPSIKDIVREWVAILLIVPVLLTLIIGSAADRLASPQIVTSLAVNFLITLSISLSIAGAYGLVAKRIDLENRAAWLRLIVHAVLIAVGVVVGTRIALMLAGLFFPRASGRFPERGVMLVATPVSLVIVLISQALGRLKVRAQETELREEKARHELLGAQLKALQARTNPHFLFNSLNTVAALIGEDPARAEQAVERLASLFRYALDGSERLKVPLSAEIEAVTSYLEFERLRFGDRLRTTIEIAPGLERASVPALVLQPLVENAVNHGVASKRSGANVAIRASRKSGEMILIVEDDGPGPEQSAHQGTRTAQSDLSTRLRLHYGERAKLLTGPKDQGGFRAEVIIPLEEMPP